MTASLSMQAEIREKRGKNAARSLRRAQKVPAVIYRSKEKEVLVSIPQKEIQNIHSLFNIMTTLIELEIGDKKYKVLPKQISLHPVTDLVEHVDFISVDEKKKIKLKVPIKLTGKDRSLGLKRDGVLNVSNYFIECIADNDNIPESIEIDVSKLNIGDVVKLKDLTLPESMEFKSKNTEHVVLKMSGKRKIELEEDTPEEAEGEAAEEATKEEGAEEASDNTESKKSADSNKKK
jgi:large subunit ribosomal protein L25